MKSVVDIARGLGKRTIAEFVEDAETLELLRGMGVDFAQGFYVAKPGAATPAPGAAPTSRERLATWKPSRSYTGRPSLVATSVLVVHAPRSNASARAWRDQLARTARGRAPRAATATIWTSLFAPLSIDRAAADRLAAVVART